ncbi:MAG: UvrD-helicase domain-containing protein [Gammaproteobacteria bacterium]|nr:UvrD-helicase domain-containing protein [Gammaproteobacteria bacterium]
MQRLNPRQREAVHHHDGPLLVLAGAGSGKTGVIAHKIAYLIDNVGVDPAQITAITFTNKAAREMRERVKGLLGRRQAKPWISTFHTLGLRILREEHAVLGYRRGFSILDAGDCAGLLADLMRRDSPGTDVAVNQVQQAISAWKYALVPPAALDSHGLDKAQALAARCYAPYCETLMTYNAVDFDDLIMGPVRILREDEGVRERWRERIDYLLVDEYQDTNLSQYELVRLLIGGHQRLTAVGDDDQSIYAWRGARPENILRLGEDFPRLKVVKLEQNYRSTGIILKAANTLIANNPHVYDKKLWSEHGFGDKIRVAACGSEHDETERVANDILHRRLLHGGEYRDFAVLLRSNHQARLFEHAFREREIPYVLSGGRSFFDYSEIKDCVCYLRLLANPDDNNALLRVINTPRRAIGPQTLKVLVDTAATTGTSLVATAQSMAFAARVSPQTEKRVRQFIDWFVDFQRTHEATPAPEAFATLLGDIGYDDWLEQSSDDETAAARRKQNVAELKRWIERIHAADESRTTADIVAALTLFDIADRQDSESELDGVALTTLHAAKGLEYPHVYLAGFEENLLPHRSSIEQDTIEEERRLAYVGITRARRTLTMTFCRTRKRFGQVENCAPSRFLDELPAEELAWEGAQTDPAQNRATGRGTLDQLKRLLKT